MNTSSTLAGLHVLVLADEPHARAALASLLTVHAGADAQPQSSPLSAEPRSAPARRTGYRPPPRQSALT